MTKEETKYCKNCKACKRIYYDWTWKVKCNRIPECDSTCAVLYCKHKKERK